MKGIRQLVLIAALATACSLSAQQSALDQAHKERDARNYVQAAQLYREALASQPDNTEALGGLADSLEASGNWREAVPFLEHLTTLEPANAARLAQLGRMKSWQKGQRVAALELLKRACDQGKGSAEYCTQYADVLSWRSENRQDAIKVLRGIVTANPGFVPAITRLAEVLSWDRATRQESIQLFESAVLRDPDNADLFATYGDVLTYQSNSRQTAMSCYNNALKLDANNLRALNGKAQVLAWGGRTNEAMALYDKVLSMDAQNAYALRGKAEILNWREQYQEAGALLEHAREVAPDDARITAEIARTDIGRNHLGEARQTLALLPFDPEFRDLRGEVSRALGTYVEMGYVARRNRQNLDYNQLQTAISTPLGLSNRVTFSYSPTLYKTTTDEFNGNSYSVQLDSRFSENAALTTHVSADTYPGLSTAVDGGTELRYRVRPSFEIQAGFQRANVDDSLLSTRGVDVAGVELGQVRSNLGSLGFSYNNSRHHYDFWTTYSDGIYTGLNLDANRRWGFDGQVGKSIRGAGPYIRLAYGVSYSQFQYDATEPVTASQAGGYFSPHRFLLNYGALTVNHKFNNRIEFQSTGTLGAQNVEARFSDFGNAQLASSFRSRLLMRVSDKNEIRVGYDFLNVYNAFHRHLPSISWRHYF